jgi:hypothetical protein
VAWFWVWEMFNLLQLNNQQLQLFLRCGRQQHMQQCIVAVQPLICMQSQQGSCGCACAVVTAACAARVVATSCKAVATLTAIAAPLFGPAAGTGCRCFAHDLWPCILLQPPAVYVLHVSLA